MQVVEHLEPTEGEEGQWLGVYITRWQRGWGQPTEMFRDVELADVPEVKALVEALEMTEQTYGNAEGPGMTERALMAKIQASLAPFKEAAGD